VHHTSYYLQIPNHHESTSRSNIFDIEVRSDSQAAGFDTTINFDPPFTMHPFHYVLGQRYLRQSETHENFTCHLANLMVYPRIWPSTDHVFGSISTSQDVSPAWLQPLCYSDQAIPRSNSSFGGYSRRELGLDRYS
jgi:hypothetical protein